MTTSQDSEYCVGFLFSNNCVLLLERQRPDWQKGKWNGVGGHLDPGESALRAMEREFKEETGKSIPASEWKEFGALRGIKPDGGRFTLHCFKAKTNIYEMLEFRFAKPITPEGELEVYSLNELPEVLPNVRWLIEMARSFDNGEHARFFTITQE